MKFATKLPSYGQTWLKWKILQNARKVIICHKLKPSEIQLNNLLIQNYKMNLTNACLAVVKHCTVHASPDGELVIVFNDNNYDRLASLITYGNLEVPGSNILKKAFLRKE